MQKKIENIQALRGVAALLVVFFHIMATERKFGNGGAILPSFLEIGNTGVDLFFVISGFIMVTVTRGKFQNFRYTLGFSYKRATRIYPLYWFYTALMLVYFLLPQEMFARSREDVDLFRSFLLLPQINMPLLVIAWSLTHEMYFYGIFAVLLLFSEKRFTKLLAGWAFLVIVVGAVFWSAPSSNFAAAMQLITHPLTMEFIAGCIIAKMVFSGIRAHGLTLLGVGIFILVINRILFNDISIYNSALDGWIRLFFNGVPCALIVYGATAAELGAGVKFPKFLQIVGDSSYSIYLSHYMVLSMTGRLWPIIMGRLHINGAGYMDNMFAIAGMLFVVLAVGIGSYNLIEKPLLNLSRKVKF